MSLLSLTAYAETHGASRQAAGKWREKGALVMSGEMVDVEASDRKMESFGMGRFRAKAHGGRRAAGVRGVSDRPGLHRVAPAAEKHAAAEESEARRIVAYRAARPESFGAHLASEAAALEQAARTGHPLDFEALSEMADTATWSDINEDRDVLEWLAWPARIAADLAAELGIPDFEQALQRALERRVRDRLEGEMLRSVEDILRNPPPK